LRIRAMGNVGWNRESWPTNAELLSFEACLNEIAERFPCVVLCLHEVSALTAAIAVHGAFGTHPRILTERGVFESPFAPLLGRSLRLDSIASALARQEEHQNRKRREIEMLQAVFDNIPVMISVYDASGRLLLVNHEWERVLGWTIAEAQAMGLSFLSKAYPDPERRREVIEFMQKAEGRWKDFRTRERNGKTIDTSWLRVALSDGTRIGFGLDLTERRRLEKGIKTSEALLSEGEKLSHTGSWVLNIASGELLWSAETFRIFGLEPGQQGPSHPFFFDMLHYADRQAAEGTVYPADRTAVQRALQRTLVEKANFEMDHRIVRSDGSIRDVHVVGHPVFSESGELQEYVGVLMDVTERRRVEELLQRSHNELRDLSERLRTIREEESARIAREVHDGVGQALTALQMEVARLEKRASGAPESESFSAKLRSMAELIDQTIAAVQRIASDLRPAVLDELGLEAAIEWYVREFEDRAGIACDFRSDLDGTRLDPGTATAVFRILQEALTNVIRHSGATRVQVELTVDPKRLLLEVRDNGRGIPEDRVADSRSLGLLGMRERARFLGGDVSVRGDPNHGTKVSVTIPR